MDGSSAGYLDLETEYDIHGWVRDITLDGGYPDPVFEEVLRYAAPTRSALIPARYDGNISEMTVRHGFADGSMTEETWGYRYDRMGRLQDADHFPGPGASPVLSRTERAMTYDLNGNITALRRYGESGLSNDLTFVHSGNRMTSLTDSQATGDASGAKAFTYDANGNLTRDGRQDLEIRWNILNLASGAETHDGSLTFARLSDGTLVSLQKTSGGNTNGKRYCGSFILTTGTGVTAPQVESVAWDEGRIILDESTGTYRDCWYAGDHLGNVRSVVDISTGQSSPVVLEQNDYLPFGGRIENPHFTQFVANRWRYAGKEEYPELNLLDFGARMYDPFTARWAAVDPMVRTYHSINPYAYCANDPVNRIDPNGCVDWRLVRSGATNLALGAGTAAVGAAIVGASGGTGSLLGGSLFLEGGGQAVFGFTNVIIGLLSDPSEETETLRTEGITSPSDAVGLIGDELLGTSNGEIRKGVKSSMTVISAAVKLPPDMNSTAKAILKLESIIAVSVEGSKLITSDTPNHQSSTPEKEKMSEEKNNKYQFYEGQDYFLWHGEQQ